MKNIDINNINKIKKKLKEINKISFRKSKKIRTQEISKLASKIAVHNFVRNFVNKLQYEFVKKNKNNQRFCY